MGLITFEWTEQFGASQNRIDITLPSGNVESNFIEETSYQRYLESLPTDGEFSWLVKAIDEVTILFALLVHFLSLNSNTILNHLTTSKNDSSAGGPGPPQTMGENNPTHPPVSPSVGWTKHKYAHRAYALCIKYIKFLSRISKKFEAKRYVLDGFESSE